MTSTAIVRIGFDTKEQLSSILEAIEPETRSDLSDRVTVRAKGEDKTLTLTFNAKDTSALRAALNSYLHWIRLAKDVLETVSNL